jgi:thymidine phosphorylase
VAPGTGHALARSILDDGRAWRKFQAICAAQGGMRAPGVARYRQPVEARATGRVVAIDNRRLARAAKLAGAPTDPAAGVALHVCLGAPVARAEPMFTVHAETPGQLSYALAWVARQPDVVSLAAP